MRAHVIENGKVANTIEVESLDFLPNLIDAELGGKIGDEFDGEVFTTPIVTPTREQLKQARQAAIDSIIVTVGDKQFDGDEKSQERMLRALKVAEITGLTSTMWTLADNTNVEVTVAEISEALAKAALAQSQVWVLEV